MKTSDAVEPSQATDVPKHVLLVEDSMLIALDTEDCLRELGVGSVTIESAVAGALGRLENTTPDLAILDYNLGDETSEPVAQELARQGIPFWLATGCDEMADRIEELGAAGLLTKPYGKADLSRIMGEVEPAKAPEG